MSRSGVSIPIKALAAYFLRLGAVGFGGPIGLASAMQRDLVDDRKWFTPEEYREGLALAQLAPGPLAAQLAIYLGWVRQGLFGATVVAIAFTLPSFVMVLLLSAAYVEYGGLAWMQGAFYGIGAAVVAIIGRGAWHLILGTVRQDRLLWILCGISAVVTAWSESEMAWLFLLSGAVTVAWRHPRTMHVSLVPFWLFDAGDTKTLTSLFWFFTEAGAFVFGSGLAIVPFLHAGVVNQHHWLTERQFLDAVAVAMITPGPVVITVAFIGYLVAGTSGATVAALGVFLPCYLFVVIPAPFFRRVVGNTAISAFVDGLTAAAIGAIAGAVVVLGRRALVDWQTTAIALIALGVTASRSRVPEPLLILAAGICGCLLRP